MLPTSVVNEHGRKSMTPDAYKWMYVRQFQDAQHNTWHLYIRRGSIRDESTDEPLGKYLLCAYSYIKDEGDVRYYLTYRRRHGEFGLLNICYRNLLAHRPVLGVQVTEYIDEAESMNAALLPPL